MKLIVIPGHGNGDSGAVASGFQEQERVRALATKMKQYGGSAVELTDFSKNAYADKTITSYSYPKGSVLIELHMDSASVTAKGGHVVIQSGIGGADAYDKALASYISGMFPGRSQIVTERNDLANPKRANAKGYNYRLLECCFISNVNDLNKFNANIDNIAKGILKCFEIGTGAGQIVQTPTESTSKPTFSTIASGSTWVRSLQQECNAQKFSNQKVDGIVGPKTLAGCPTLRKGAKGNITRLLQQKLISFGFHCGSFGADGIFGNGTYNAVIAFQRSRGLVVDGIVGPNTWRKILGM